MIGRIRATLVERAADAVGSGDPGGDSIVRLRAASDLLEVEALLSRGAEHARRLRLGDVCLTSLVDGRPAGLLWLNLHGHADQYLGGASRPTASHAYYNQLIVLPQFRRAGVARELVRAALRETASAGRTQLRAAVLDGNEASRKLHSALDFRPVQRVLGVRVGSVSLRLPAVATQLP